MTELLSPPQARVEVDQLLERHRISGAAAVAYFSFDSPQSFIAARDPDGTITPLIGFWPLPVRGDELLDAIASIDGTGRSLVGNYADAFAELTAAVRTFGSDLDPLLESASLGWLLSACSVVLGMRDEDVARALGPVSGLVKVDTPVVEREGGYVLDSRRLLRSAMSYRIAAVPNHVLVRSVFESLGDYAAAALRRLLRDWKVDVVAFAGDLFARNRFIAERARRGLLRPRLQVCFPETVDATCA
jgi:hypothetical protein